MRDQARLEINDALLSYCRGIDRLRADDVLAAFHSGAMLIDYGGEPMTIEVFTEYALASLAKRYSGHTASHLEHTNHL